MPLAIELYENDAGCYGISAGFPVRIDRKRGRALAGNGIERIRLPGNGVKFTEGVVPARPAGREKRPKANLATDSY